MSKERDKAAKDYAVTAHKFIDERLTAQAGFIAGAEWALKQQSEALEKAKQDGFEEGSEYGKSAAYEG